MNKFAERLKEALVVGGFSQNKFAKLIGTTQQTVNRWCSGICEPNFDMLLLVCKELSEGPNYLLGWED